jgi:uncharacterized membrane-anchored protein
VSQRNGFRDIADATHVPLCDFNPMNTRAFLLSLVSSVVGGSGLAKVISSSTGEQNALSFDPNLIGLPEAQTSGIVRIGSCAQVDLPAGFDFVSEESYQRWLRQMGLGNISAPEWGRMRHSQSGWTAQFKYCDEGHLLDDEKDQLDEDAILKVLQEKERGLEPIYKQFKSAQTKTLGFELAPRYDEQARLLEWAGALPHRRRDRGVDLAPGFDPEPTRRRGTETQLRP